MRCSEARARLNRPDQIGQPDGELREHLATCRSCAQEAQALGLLSQILESAAKGDDRELVSLKEQRVLVEARAYQARRGVRSDKPGLVRRLSYGGVLVTAMIVLAVVTMVPFQNEHTLGYNVSFDGVDVDLAQDGERICDMLYLLGLHDADFDLLGCDTTCNLLIVDLKTEAEAHLVVAAVTSISEAEVTSSVIPITDRSLTALQ